MRGVLITFFVVAQAVQGQQASFQAMLNTPGSPTAISGDGSTVILTAFQFPANYTPYRWRSAHGFEGLNYEGAADSISTDGNTIAGFMWSTQAEAVPVRWTPQSGAVPWPIPFSSGRGQAISPDGLYIAVGRGFAGTRVKRWHGGEVINVSPPGTEIVNAVGVSENGAAVVSLVKNKAEAERSYLWREGAGYVEFPRLHSDSAFIARDMTPDGRVVVGRAWTGTQSVAARWVLHELRPLFLPSSSAEGLLVSGDGWTILGESSDFPGFRFIWDPVRGPRDLRQQFTDWGITGHHAWAPSFRPIDISYDGRVIVGDGLDGRGQYAMWVATIPAFCYANCDGSTVAPALNVADFTCFLHRFAGGDMYGNCDNDGFINVADFVCFLQKFAAGCP